MTRYPARRQASTSGRSIADRAASPLDEAIGSEAVARYEDALQRLRPEEREMIIARVEMQQSYAQIAAAHGKASPDAARMAVTRALVRLAEEMDVERLRTGHSRIWPRPSRTAPRSTGRASRRAPRRRTGGSSAIFASSRALRRLHRSISVDDGGRPAFRSRRRRRARNGAASSFSIGSAKGTSCEVFRPGTPTLHREVALKLLHGGRRPRGAHARLLDEARRLARVRHQHVVQVYGAETHDGRVGLWMELVRGESLEQIVQARGPFGAREAAVDRPRSVRRARRRARRADSCIATSRRRTSCARRAAASC